MFTTIVMFALFCAVLFAVGWLKQFIDRNTK